MASNGDGSIVVTSSMASIEANPLLGAYGAAKAAPNSVVRNIAAERGPHNIRANTIAPGIVRTGFSQALWQDGENEGRLSAKIPLGRIAEPDEVVGAAPLFGTPAGAYISGTTLMIDGGRQVI
jgi:NAD(P)-dependent dehydrogenase (short-subunit alcohol dehydrogenase family)